MSTEKQEKKEYPDFLRQVVVRVLTPNKLDPVKLEDARKILGKAETKYRFSSFGGDPQNLVVFLLSPEFTDLILVIGVQLSQKVGIFLLFLLLCAQRPSECSTRGDYI